MVEQMEGLNNSHKDLCFAFKEQQKNLFDSFNESFDNYCRTFNQQQILFNEEIVKICFQANQIFNKIN